jgi:parallel beta-helix repeat protein
MKYTAVLLCILLVTTFTIVIWNMYLPISSNRNAEFLDYAEYIAMTHYNENDFLQNNINNQLVQPAMAELENLGIVQGTPVKLNVGQRQVYDLGTSHKVTLTFYVQYGNQQNLLPLLDLLHEYGLQKAVFFMEERYLEEHEFVAQRIRDQGYTIKIWHDLDSYNEPGYSPTVYRGVPLVENEVLSLAQKDRDASEFFRVALHHGDASVAAFTPKIIPHKLILENILVQGGKSLQFSDQPAEGNNDIGTDQLPTSHVEVKVSKGAWTMTTLAKAFPSLVNYSESDGGYLVLAPVIIGKDASLSISGEKILLRSPFEGTPSYIEVRGNAVISNSTVMSWDLSTSRPAIDPYVPRPYIIIIGGHLDVINSTITHLGYSLGGLTDTRYAHAALEYYETKDFVVANSTIAFNYYGFYSEDSSNFKIVNNHVYGQTRYGLDPHTRSTDFLIDSNYVHDNGNQGIICSLWCENVVITNNTVEYNVEGIGLHWLTNSSTIKDNVVRFNEKYGIFIQKDSYENLIEGNIIVGNGRGIGLLEGSLNNTITGNIIAHNALEAVKSDPDSMQNAVQGNTFQYDLEMQASALPSRKTEN